MAPSSSSVTIKATARDKAQVQNPSRKITVEASYPIAVSEFANPPEPTGGSIDPGHTDLATGPFASEIDTDESKDGFEDVPSAIATESSIQTHRFSINPRKIAPASSSRKKQSASESQGLIPFNHPMTTVLRVVAVHTALNLFSLSNTASGEAIPPTSADRCAVCRKRFGIRATMRCDDCHGEPTRGCGRISTRPSTDPKVDSHRPSALLRAHAQRLCYTSAHARTGPG